MRSFLLFAAGFSVGAAGFNTSNIFHGAFSLRQRKTEAHLQTRDQEIQLFDHDFENQYDHFQSVYHLDRSHSSDGGSNAVQQTPFFESVKNAFAASWGDSDNTAIDANAADTDTTFGYFRSKFSPRKAAAPAVPDEIHICLFSDRLEAISVPIRSVVDKTTAPEKVHFWIVTVPGRYSKFRDYFKKQQHLFLGASIHVLNLDKVTNDLIDDQVIPVWKWKTFGSSLNSSWTKTRYSVEPVAYDRDDKHMHPLNHLRFYLAHMPQFKNVEKIILMDDDVIIQGDIAEFYTLPVPREQSLVTNCYKWKYTVDPVTKQHTDAQYSDGQAAANFLLLRFKDANSQKRHDLLHHLEAIHQNVTGEHVNIMKMPYWNFGLTLFDLGNWREQQLTDVYQRWMIENYRRRIFQETTLSYGLGIPFLSLLGRVSCLPEQTKVIDGLGWLPFNVIQKGGYTEEVLPDMFALHYCGWWKPWEEKGRKKLAPALKTPWSQVQKNLDVDMAQERVRRRLRKAQQQQHKKIMKREKKKAFLLAQRSEFESNEQERPDLPEDEWPFAF